MPRPNHKVDATIATKRMANSTNSPLLQLPAEVRNIIYGYAFATNEALEITFKNINYQTRLLRVCHQIRQEARPIFYSVASLFIANIHETYTRRFLEEAGRSMACRIQLLLIRLAVPQEYRSAFDVSYRNIAVLRSDPTKVPAMVDTIQTYQAMVSDLAVTLRSYGIRVATMRFGLRRHIRCSLDCPAEQAMYHCFVHAADDFPTVSQNFLD
jgi:hypothetical protein